MPDKPLTFPTIHHNGTHPDRLMEALSEAYDALGTAYDVLRETAPNGRDFYHQGDAAIVSSTEEHMSRLKRVHDVRDELQRIVNNIQDQVWEQNRP